MALDVNKLATFGDVRRDILETLQMLKSGTIPVSTGMALFAGHKVLNDNIQAEINVAKFALQTKDEAHKFGRLVGMGQRLIANDENQIA
jgi:hypothetical protein